MSFAPGFRAVSLVEVRWYGPKAAGRGVAEDYEPDEGLLRRGIRDQSTTWSPVSRAK